MSKIVLASSNPGKLREFNALFNRFGIDIVPQSEFNVPDVDETGLTFVENAILKARNAAEHSGFPSISDDSGIEIDALNGEPGIYSARYAGTDPCSDAGNNDKVLKNLEHTPDDERTARYQCLMVYMSHAKDPTPIITQGSWEGRILRARQGDGGFGYDPIFYVPTHKCSGGELDPEVKNHISHRASAMQDMVEALKAAGIVA